MRPSDHRRARIVAAAGSLAAAGGYDAVTMRAVATHADLSTATLYRYFPSKHHILVAALERWLEQFEIRAAREIRVPDDPFDRLWSVVDALYASLHHSPLLAEAMARAYAAADVNAADQVENIRARLIEIFASALGDDDSGHHEAVGMLLSDVWAANVLALSHNRISATELRRRLAVTVRLLARQDSGVRASALATAACASPGMPADPRPRPS
ncbi:TetR/AcrR family transcriptional regulator [Mycobacterium sp. URHD0025]|uniref:TetR/AcrR family transcriptional regulator n=1 Tax=Mycobacterium sp. URHD0025 TaxID=1298864 RepID=UPI0009DB8E7E|nr:TetR/AcrR family transcriptional regulator [Mycobacterium sp. URHD0025]